MGGTTPTLEGLCKENGLREGGGGAKVTVKAEDNIGDFVEHVGGGRSIGRRAEQQQWGGSKKVGRRRTNGNRAMSRWTDDPGAEWSGAEWGRIHQEPGGRKTDKTDGAGIVGLHSNKRQILRLQ